MAKSKQPKILIWDIESTNLNAPFGTILCIGYKFLGENKVHVPSIFDYKNKTKFDDEALVTEFAKVYSESDYTVAHYGTYFDLPMIKTKLLRLWAPCFTSQGFA